MPTRKNFTSDYPPCAAHFPIGASQSGKSGEIIPWPTYPDLENCDRQMVDFDEDFVFDNESLAARNHSHADLNRKRDFAEPAPKKLTKLHSEIPALKFEKLSRAAEFPESKQRFFVRESAVQAAKPKLPCRKNRLKSAQLWTEKYRPVKAGDFVGNEKALLDAVRWVRSWKLHLDKPSSSPKPEHCVLMFSGTPGVGKTTLASIAAKVAGFEPISINASDERGGALVIEKITAACKFSRVDGELRSIIVLDEVDGAAEQGLIRFLAGLASGASIREISDELPDPEASSSAKKAKKSLSFPIICMCNDLYASSLRNIRNSCLNIRLAKLTAQEIYERLRSVCEAEGVGFEGRALFALAEWSDGDLRSAVTTLQSAHQSYTRLTNSVLNSVLESGGRRDCASSIFGFLNSLFSSADGYTSLRQTHDASLDLFGELDRCATSAFEGYSSLPSFVDTSFSITNEICDWLHFFDSTQAAIQRSQDYSLVPVQSLVFCAFRYLCQSGKNSFGAFRTAKVDFEFFQLSERIKSLVAEIAQFSRTDRSRFRLDFLPALCWLADPISCGVANSTFVRASQKQEVRRIIKVMRHFGLSYKQQKSPTSDYQFQLEPPIYEALVGKSKGRLLNLSDPMRSYQAKQLIFTEMMRSEISGEPAAANAQAIAPITATEVWYRYHEGISNAVRRPIRMCELFASKP